MPRKPVTFSVSNFRFPNSPNQAKVVLLLNEGLCSCRILAQATDLSTRTVLRALRSAGGILHYQDLWTSIGKRRIWWIKEPKAWVSLVVPRALDILNRTGFTGLINTNMLYRNNTNTNGD